MLKPSEEDRRPLVEEDKDDFEGRVEVPESSENVKFSFRKLWAFTGPGFLMSIAYLDPGNVESDLQSGSVAQYELLWVLLFAHILGFLLQRLSARLGVVSGKHMAEVAFQFYPKVPRIFLWLMVELAIVGSDMQEVIGTAIALYLLSSQRIPIWAGVIITICDTFTFLLLDRYGFRKLEGFFGFLIAIMALTFGYEYVRVKPDQVELIKGFIPFYRSFKSDALLQGVAMIGAVIMPHNLYLYSALVKSRNINRQKKQAVSEANFYYMIEAAIALFCSFIINMFALSVFASVLYGNTNAKVRANCLANNISYAHEFPDNNNTVDINIYRGGLLLGCDFSLVCLYIWAIGILAAGQSSTMAGTYVGQFVMEGFLNLHWSRWKRVLLTRSIAILPSVLVSMRSIQDLSTMNDLLNALQALLLPFALVPLLTFTSSPAIMCDFRSGKIVRTFLYVISFVVIIINVYFLARYVVLIAPNHWSVYTSLVLAGIMYSTFILYLAWFGIDRTFCMPLPSGAMCSRFFPEAKLSIEFPWNSPELASANGVPELSVQYGAAQSSKLNKD